MFGHFRRDWKEEKKKNTKEKKYFDCEYEKYSWEADGDSFVAALETHAIHIAWLIEYRYFFHITSHWNWFFSV